MGQLALGFRSLLIRLALFFLFAMLLAWALGGTLWPRPERVSYDPVHFDGRAWFWQLAVGGDQPGVARWTMMVTDPEDDRVERADERTWFEPAGPVATESAIYYGGRLSVDEDGWHLRRVHALGRSEMQVLPDRLALEHQLARLAAGLPLQDAEEIQRQRPLLLEPGGPDDS